MTFYKKWAVSTALLQSRTNTARVDGPKMVVRSVTVTVANIYDGSKTFYWRPFTRSTRVRCSAPLRILPIHECREPGTGPINDWTSCEATTSERTLEKGKLSKAPSKHTLRKPNAYAKVVPPRLGNRRSAHKNALRRRGRDLRRAAGREHSPQAVLNYCPQHTFPQPHFRGNSNRITAAPYSTLTAWQDNRPWCRR